MTIKNLDRPVIENKDQQINNVKEALETGDAHGSGTYCCKHGEQYAHFQDMMNDVINEAQQAKMKIGMLKWASRGVRVLTNEEKFYNKRQLKLNHLVKHIN